MRHLILYYLYIYIYWEKNGYSKIERKMRPLLILVSCAASVTKKKKKRERETLVVLADLGQLRGERLVACPHDTVKL
jgi:hypothetical protein